MVLNLNFLWFLIWVVVGNSVEVLVTFLHKYNGTVNVIFGASRIAYAVANFLFTIMVGVIWTGPEETPIINVFCVIVGALYSVHGILYLPGLLKYYYRVQ